MFIWMYTDYAVLPLPLNAKHGFLSLWYFGISPCFEAKTMFNCLYPRTGKPFRRQLLPNRESLHSKLHHLLSLWWWWGLKTKPNQPWCGLWTWKVQNPSATNSKSKWLFKLTRILHRIYFWFPTHWDKQNTCFYNEEVLRRGQIFLTIKDHKRAYLFLSSSWTHGYIILRLIIQLWTLLATDFSWFSLQLTAL